ncbi:MAG: CvpA family protein [Desulfocapsa sp.]|nr:MAG: CvpA family protein [Desulfocapsa sp.]
MNGSLNLTGFDFVIIGIVLLFTFRGLWVGFLSQVTTLVALLVGYFIAGQYNDKLFPFLRGLSDNQQAVFWASYVILFAITYVVTMLFGKGLAKVVELTIAGWFDKLLGGALGAVKAAVIIVLLNMVLSGVLAPENAMLRGCYFAPYLEQGTKLFRSIIKDESLRKAFVQQMPAISEKKTERSADGVRPFVPTHFPEESTPSVK